LAWLKHLPAKVRSRTFITLLLMLLLLFGIGIAGNERCDAAVAGRNATEFTRTSNEIRVIEYES
jgi:hypothetical protein